MKKLILTSVCTVALVGGAFAQGNVNWTGPSAASFTAQTNATVYSSYFGGGATGSGTVGGPAGSTTTVGQGFYFELLVGSVYTGVAQAAPSTLGGFSSWTDSGLGATNNPSGNGRTAVISGNSGATVSALSTTVSNNIVMVGWSANLGTTWSTALAHLESSSFLAGLSGQAFFGVSNDGFIEGAATTTSPGTAVFGTAANANGTGTPIFSLNTQLDLIPVPEPTSIALAVMGGASLLLFRRKK